MYNKILITLLASLLVRLPF